MEGPLLVLITSVRTGLCGVVKCVGSLELLYVTLNMFAFGVVCVGSFELLDVRLSMFACGSVVVICVGSVVVICVGSVVVICVGSVVVICVGSVVVICVGSVEVLDVSLNMFVRSDLELISFVILNVVFSPNNRLSLVPQ